jgi:hypothetical protein
MALIFESIQPIGIAQYSYLIGDDTAGIAAVIDPRPDVDCYLQTLGANPPKNPKPLFKTRDAMPSRPEYLIHSEWDATEMAHLPSVRCL